MMPQGDSDSAPPRRVELCIPWATYLQLGFVILAFYVTHVLWPLMLLVFLALLLAVTLAAFVDGLERKGINHWVSSLLVIGGLLTTLGIVMALIVPALIDQAAVFTRHLPTLREEVIRHLPASGGMRQKVESMMDSATWARAGDWFDPFISAGGIALGGITQIILFLVISIYLVMDGRKTYEWALAFFSPLERAKLRLTSEEISKVIFGFISGQIITSVLVAIFTFCVLSLFHVPAALPLAILAAILDILPLLGFIISTIPSVLLALSVSSETALAVLTLFLLFHGLENYFIIPQVYGKSLRLSTLTVLLGLLAGTLLAGIAGALAALPIIASYEAIERIWLRPYLREGVTKKHELQKNEVFGEKN